ncbi:hypothetical protein HU200_062148 [Digitaria exilis]|uniref:Uncharacterized protein n=1 Tax=Digitaria exilis TaxID=1010633 RepID=A0A835A770_9POAL|nr:hypothetical protein HU200_062148 [Digitaria exilis]
MATETPPQEESKKKAPLPKVVTLNKALKLVSSASPPTGSSNPSPPSSGVRFPPPLVLPRCDMLYQLGVQAAALQFQFTEAGSDMGGQNELGLGAKVAHGVKRAAPTNPIERRLLGKVNAQKRKALEEESRTAKEANEASDDDSDEPESRTSAFSKRTLPSVISTPVGKKAK